MFDRSFPISGRMLRSLLLGLMSTLIFAPVRAQSLAPDPAGTCAAKNRFGAATIDHLTFVSYSGNARGCLQVISGGKVVFRRTVDNFENFTFGQPADGERNFPAVANGTDVTGRGHPDMIVSLFTGGAHCCTSHFVFELEPALRLPAELDDAHDDLAHFERDAKDHRYNYITADWTFAYWPTCFACSPSEVVTLRWADDAKGGGFHLALDKMQRPAPSTAVWNRDLAAARKVVSQGDADGIGRTLWQTVLDLIYIGHSDLAWKFVGELGPKAQQAPLPSLADFCRLLKHSPYWPDLAPTLKDPPPACAAAGSATNK